MTAHEFLKTLYSMVAKTAATRSPAEKAANAQWLIDMLEESIADLRVHRNVAVSELRAAGWTQQAIADNTGITQQAVKKILGDRTGGAR